jgi:hypothetical protein
MPNRAQNRWIFAVLLAAGAMVAESASAQAADLFYNYYVAGVNGGPPAQLYLCPRPTPPLVGHTYITYQPLMPNEMMYQHHRSYRRYDDCHHLPVSVTRVHWCGHLFCAKRWHNWEIPHHAQIRNLQHP